MAAITEGAARQSVDTLHQARLHSNTFVLILRDLKSIDTGLTELSYFSSFSTFTGFNFWQPNEMELNGLSKLMNRASWVLRVILRFFANIVVNFEILFIKYYIF